MKTLSRFGSREKRYICLGPDSGQKHHYGHFDILMGTNVQHEVFPLLTQWLERHDITTTSKPAKKILTAAAPMPAAVILPALSLPVALTRMSYAVPTLATPAAVQESAVAAEAEAAGAAEAVAAAAPAGMGLVGVPAPVLQVCATSAPEHAPSVPVGGHSDTAGERYAVLTLGGGFAKRAAVQMSKL